MVFDTLSLSASSLERDLGFNGAVCGDIKVLLKLWIVPAVGVLASCWLRLTMSGMGLTKRPRDWRGSVLSFTSMLYCSARDGDRED